MDIVYLDKLRNSLFVFLYCLNEDYCGNVFVVNVLVFVLLIINYI